MNAGAGWRTTASTRTVWLRSSPGQLAGRAARSRRWTAPTTLIGKAALQNYARTMGYAADFFRRVFGIPALDAVGVVLIVVGVLLGVAGSGLAPWVSAVAVVMVLLYSSFRAFRDVALERDSASSSEESRQQLVRLLADGRARAEGFLNQLSDVIALGDYDATFQPIEGWWNDLLERVSERNLMTAAQLGSKSDIDPARRPAGATKGNMNLALLRAFLESRVSRISALLNTPQ